MNKSYLCKFQLGGNKLLIVYFGYFHIPEYAATNSGRLYRYRRYQRHSPCLLLAKVKRPYSRPIWHVH